MRRYVAFVAVFCGLFAPIALAHDADVVIERIGGVLVIPDVITEIVVPYLPYTLPVEGTVTHEGGGNLNTLELWGTDDGDYFYGPARYFKNAGGATSAPYSIPWTVTYAGVHVIGVGTFHGGGNGEPCPAAPSLANRYLRENELDRVGGDGENVVSTVARETGRNGTFWAREKCSPEYAGAVIFFVVGGLESVEAGN